MYDVIIIGSGLSGLYCAYKLSSQLNVLVLEKDDRIGGRIYTVDAIGNSIEAGAGRFNNNHKILKNLLEELKIETVEIPGTIEFKDSTDDNKYEGYTDPFKLVNDIVKYSKSKSKKLLQSQTFIEFASKHVTKKEIEFLLDSFGYYEQLVSMNAYDAIKLLDKGMSSKNTFYTIKKGMSTLTDKLHSKIKHTIKTNTEVTSIKYEAYSEDPKFYIKVKNKKTPYECRKCICALPKKALEKIPFFNIIKDKMNKVGIKVLCRIYAIFNKEDIWFNHISKTTTNNNNRYIIPIDKKEGVIMIAYTDSKYANFWKSLPENKVLPELKKNIYETFRININDPIFLKAFYWETGTAYWKPFADSKKMSEEIMQPINNVPMFICGENFSQTQGWMEGALETSSKVLKKLM